MRCTKCGGTGVVKYYYDAGNHFGAGTPPFSEWREKPCDMCKECKTCDGSGEVHSHNSTCWNCNGDGRVNI